MGRPDPGGGRDERVRAWCRSAEAATAADARSGARSAAPRQIKLPRRRPVAGRKRTAKAASAGKIAGAVRGVRVLFGLARASRTPVRARPGRTLHRPQRREYVDTAALGSIEYAVSQLGVSLVVVMGHERCGAVEAAVSVVAKGVQYPGSIGRMIEPIIPAVLTAQKDGGDLLEGGTAERFARRRPAANRVRTDAA